MSTTQQNTKIIHQHTRAVLYESNLSDLRITIIAAIASGADLRGADLSKADLRQAILCRATIDGAKVAVEDIGGPGHILCALTDAEWDVLEKGRN